MRGTCGEARLFGNMLYGAVNIDCSMHERVCACAHTNRKKNVKGGKRKIFPAEYKLRVMYLLILQQHLTNGCAEIQLSLQMCGLFLPVCVIVCGALGGRQVSSPAQVFLPLHPSGIGTRPKPGTALR